MCSDETVIDLPDGAVVLARRNDKGGFSVWIPESVNLSPFAWGILLTDIARNAARVETGENLGSQVEFLTELKRGFDAEWESPTDWPRMRKAED